MFLGRIKGTNLKRIAKQIVGKYPSMFVEDFSKNKAKLREIGMASESKSDLSKLAGEITVEMRKERQQQEND